MSQVNQKMLISSSPHVHQRFSTSRIMWSVVLCLIPAAIWGIYIFGPHSVIVLTASVAAAVATEGVFNLFYKKVTVLDGSAFLTGFLVGFNMPPSVPIFIPIIASVFAIAVVKWTFGGLGTNWMNPALAGRVFVFFSWTGRMTIWNTPSTWESIDAVTSASPLGAVKSGLMSFSGVASGPMDLLTSQGYGQSSMDASVTSWLNSTIFAPLHISIPSGYVDLFVGNIPGCIGEVSALLLLIGTIYLFANKIITWEIPVSYLLSFSVLIWIFGGTLFDNGLFSGDVTFHLFTGGLMLGVFYMATDMVTSPLNSKGQLIFGIGAGVLTFLIRLYGSFPEGVSLAIILMNIFVPFIDRYTQPKRFGVNGKGTAE
ncbi:MAG: RnfABCDGE type electron transport complex subunit D [Spirochaetia bacterium]